MARVHIAGAGLAGLAAAVRLTLAGRQVVLYEAAQQAGGRCRSYFDRTLGRVIDNGNHLLLSGNRNAMAYLDAIGARDSLVGPEGCSFPFIDLIDGRRWTVRPNRGVVPFWIAMPSRRVPGTTIGAYLAGWRLARATSDQTVADCLDPRDPLWRAFWDPMATAVLNTPPETGSAQLLWAALWESFARGADGCMPLIARESLAASLIDPALALLAKHGVTPKFGHRLRAIERDRRATGLDFGQSKVEIEEEDSLIVALPPAQVTAMLEITVPDGSHPIVNGHFRLPQSLPDRPLVTGLVGGTAQWLFVREDLASLTVSAADELAEEPAEAVAERLWQDTARTLDLPAAPMPPVRIVKEKRATFSQTPDAVRLRPTTGTAWPNVFLAGDWTATGLPATIEGAIRSGDRAAEHVLAHGRDR
ncbi:MAG: hydroxysqualene dehydroxylase HpnE [Pseudomonadota bacterium]